MVRDGWWDRAGFRVFSGGAAEKPGTVENQGFSGCWWAFSVCFPVFAVLFSGLVYAVFRACNGAKIACKLSNDILFKQKLTGLKSPKNSLKTQARFPILSGLVLCCCFPGFCGLFRAAVGAGLIYYSSTQEKARKTGLQAGFPGI